MIDRCPANSSVIPNPTFSIRCQARKKCEQAITAGRLRPIAVAHSLEPAGIDDISTRLNAVGIAVSIDTRQQIRTAGAIRQERVLS